MNVPILAAAALGGTYVYQKNKTPTADQLTATSLETCSSRRCPPQFYQIHVDRPVNTVLRDDTGGGGTLRGTYQYVNRQYATEARESPGVKLVAHTVR